MKRYLVFRNYTKYPLDQMIRGSNGCDAISKALPVHMVGAVRRVRAWETPDFILTRVITQQGIDFSAGLHLGYKYHPPIIKIVKR
jgi:hypothetical protein